MRYVVYKCKFCGKIQYRYTLQKDKTKIRLKCYFCNKVNKAYSLVKDIGLIQNIDIYEITDNPYKALERVRKEREKEKKAIDMWKEIKKKYRN